jgi:alpha-tubulin suppressor-like RCC1 family protein
LTVSPNVISKPTAIAAGRFHSVALDSDGNYYGWGLDAVGETSSPPLREGSTRFTAIAANLSYSLALDDQGNLYRTGAAAKALPTLREDATRFTAIAAGGLNGFALDDQGNIYSWGSDQYRQNNLPTLRGSATQFTAIASGKSHSLALDDQGNIYTWGQDWYSLLNVPTLREDATQFTDIAAGEYHSLALDDQGNLYTWGRDWYSLLNVPTLREDASRFTAISGGLYHSLALDDQGNIYSWGWNSNFLLDVPTLAQGANRFTSISAGATLSLALDDQGNIYSWGWTNQRQSEIPASLSPVFARSMPIAMGGLSAYGIEDTQSIYAFTGQNMWFENSNYISVAAGPRHLLALTRSGTVEGAGDSDVGQLKIPYGLSGVVQVVAGYAYSAALRSNGTVVEWGAHTAPAGNLITKPDNLPRLRQLASGLTHVLGITTDGGVVAWGDNTSEKATPPDGLDDVIAAAANSYCSAALRENGDLVYWGSCQDSILAKSSAPGATAIAMSDFSMSAIVNGEIITWGEDANDLLAAPAGNNYVALSAGTSAFLAVTTDGTVRSWGNNYGESITIPEFFGGPAPIVNDDICQDCDLEPQEFTMTDEDLANDAAFYATLLTPQQQKIFIEALGGSTAKPLTPDQIQALIDAATAAERENSRKLLEAALATKPAPETSAAKVLPAAKSPLTKIGARITTNKAVTVLGLKKVTKVSFIQPKKANTTCTVTAKAITAKGAGTCNVKVRYTDSKKKVRNTTLTLSIGS